MLAKMNSCVSFRAFVAFAVTGLVILSAQSAASQDLKVKLPIDLVKEGFLFYEEYGDNRPTNTLNPSPPATSALKFLGTLSIGNGSLVNAGPGFVSPTFPGNPFPYVLLDENRNLLLLHPGTGGTGPGSTTNKGASVSWRVPKSDVYHVAGAFARANDFQLAGDGVDLAIFTSFNSAVPFFASNIFSDHVVNADDPFAGTGVAPFNFTASLAQGDVLRFVVFSGPQGQDGTFDVTALEVNISRSKPK